MQIAVHDAKEIKTDFLRKKVEFMIQGTPQKVLIYTKRKRKNNISLRKKHESVDC